MWLSQIQQMSVGPLWLLRQTRTESEAAASASVCASCGEPWLQLSGTDPTRLVVLAQALTDSRQESLLHNCLRSAGWQEAAWFQCHKNCAGSERALQVLQQTLLDSGGATVLVIGTTTAQLLSPAAQRGQAAQTHGATVIVTHHPEQMLTDPALKAEVWSDLCLANGYVA